MGRIAGCLAEFLRQAGGFDTPSFGLKLLDGLPAVLHGLGVHAVDPQIMAIFFKRNRFFPVHQDLVRLINFIEGNLRRGIEIKAPSPARIYGFCRLPAGKNILVGVPTPDIQPALAAPAGWEATDATRSGPTVP